MTKRLFLKHLLFTAALCGAGSLSAQSTARLFPSTANTDSLLLTSSIAAQEQAAGCRPGDLEIGRQETADEIIVYCSRVSCEQISLRVKQDIAAQKTLEISMVENNADLKEWAQENDAQQSAALKTAVDALFKTLQDFSAVQMDIKIARLQDELNRRTSEGATISSKLEKVRTLRSACARWSEVSGELRIDTTPGANGKDTWVALQEWAARAGKQSAALNSSWTALSSDPEIRQMLKDEGLDSAFDLLNRGLKPVLAGSFEMARFLVNYGYDASASQARRLQILQRASQAGTNLVAECKLDRLMNIDVRNMNVCNGRLPAPDSPDPEAQRCVPGR